MSVWEKESFYSPQDVIIVGSGLVGLWSALELKLKHPLLKITILERGMVPYGASTRNAGFACFGSPTELLHDRDVLGEDEMWNIVELRYRGMEKMIRLFKNETTGFERCGGYEVYEPHFINWNELNENIQWLNAGLQKITGTKNCFTWADEALKQFGFSGFGSMIENKMEGYLHSGKLVQALMKRILSLGIQVFTNMEVKGWDYINDHIHVNTSSGTGFSSRQLLICTNAFTSSLLTEINIKPARGQVILTSPVEGLKMKGTFHFDEGFYYFRNLGNRILLGGARNTAVEEETTTVMATTDAIQQRLEAFISTHLLPGRPFTIEQRWSGIMGFTDDKKPLLKRINDHVAVAVACNGMGVALAPSIAEEVEAMLMD